MANKYLYKRKVTKLESVFIADICTDSVSDVGLPSWGEPGVLFLNVLSFIWDSFSFEDVFMNLMYMGIFVCR